MPFVNLLSSHTPEGDSDFFFRHATDDDESALLDLFRESFGRPISRSLWKWLSRDAPTGSLRTSLAISRSTSELAASYSMLPLSIKIGNVVTPASLANNANVRPSYRMRGLFTALSRFTLAREAKAGALFSYGMPNPSARPGHMKVGWRIAANLPFLVKSRPEARRHMCEVVDSFDSSIDAVLKKADAHVAFAISKDSAYLNWRSSRPGSLYTRFVFGPRANPTGCMVCKHFDDGRVTKSHILSLHATNGEALQDLIAAAEDFAAGRDQLTLWKHPTDPYREAFLSAGFTEHDTGDCLIIHTNRGDEIEISDEALRVTLADNDVY